MTKYVVQSGGIKKPELAKKGEEYFMELFKGTNNCPKLLWCFFASLPNSMEAHYNEYFGYFSGLLPQGKTIEHKLASVESFAKEVAWADVVYFHGGNPNPLKEVLQEYDIPTLLNEKNVGLNSASMIAFSKHYWTCDERILEDGLGIHNHKTIAHYDSDYGKEDPRGQINWHQAKAELEAYGDASLPIYALKEGEFIVIEQ